MIKLDDFRKLALPITWKLIDIGFKGSEKFANELLPLDILTYAIDRMRNNSEDKDLVNLACEYETNLSEINKGIKILSHKEPSQYDIEFRKWRVVFVSKALPDAGIDFLEGLMALGDIWLEFDFPEDSPHVFQGRNNCITPEQYYTLENYHDSLQKHRDWVNNEVGYISSLSIHEV